MKDLNIDPAIEMDFLISYFVTVYVKVRKYYWLIQSSSSRSALVDNGPFIHHLSSDTTIAEHTSKGKLRAIASGDRITLNRDVIPLQ